MSAVYLALAFAAILAAVCTVTAHLEAHDPWPAVAQTVADHFDAHADQAMGQANPRIPTQRGAERWPDGGVVDWDVPDGAA